MRTWLLKRATVGPRRTTDNRLRLKEITYYYIHTPFLVGAILQTGGYILFDLVQPKMSPTLSFSSMYKKPFIYRRNKTNSQ